MKRGLTFVSLMYGAITVSRPHELTRTVTLKISSGAYEFAPKVDSFVGREALNKDYGDSFLGRMKAYGMSKIFLYSII